MASHDDSALKPMPFATHPPMPILFHSTPLRSWDHNRVSPEIKDSSTSATLLPLSDEITASRASSSATMDASLAAANPEVQQVPNDHVDAAFNIYTDRISANGRSSDQAEEVADFTSDITSEIASNQYRDFPLGNLIASDIIVVSEGGDRTLIIGTEANKAAFLVSHKTLETKCPKLLQASKSAFNDEKFYIFDGYDWDPLPMRLVLDIAHGNFHHLPRCITLSTLAQLSHLAENCDLVEMLLPFVLQGLRSLAHQAHVAHLSWMHIAWVFGFRELFHAQVKYHIEHVTRINGQLSLFEPDDVRKLLSSTCEDGLYDIIKESRLQCLEKLSSIIKHFSNLNNWWNHAPCQINDETAAWERDQCVMLRYAFFQGAVNEKYKTLEIDPYLVQGSVQSCVSALLHIDCFDDAEAKVTPSAASFQKIGHDECGFHSFKEAIYEMYEFDKQRNASLYELMQDHFAQHHTNDDAMFGTPLHPASGLFTEADTPSKSQMAKHRAIAERRKVIKLFKQEPDIEVTATPVPPDRSRASDAGLFVSSTTDRAEATLSHGKTVPSDHVIDCLNNDNELPDDTDYDSDLYEYDTQWELDSNCSTEPDDEFFEEINEIEVYRQLRGVHKAPPPLEKRKRKPEVDLTADGEASDEESPERERKKARREERKSRKEEKNPSKEEKKKTKKGSPGF